MAHLETIIQHICVSYHTDKNGYKSHNGNKLMHGVTMQKICKKYNSCKCSGGQGEFNEITPEFIGEMVYS